MNRAIKENKRTSLFVSETKFDLEGLNKKRVVDTGSSSEMPPLEEERVSFVNPKMSMPQSEMRPIKLEESTTEIKPAENINLKMTMVNPIVAKAQKNIPTQNSALSINADDIEVDCVETLPDI